MENVYVHRSVDSCVHACDVGAGELVSLQHALLSPVSPVEPVFEHGHREDVLYIVRGTR